MPAQEAVPFASPEPLAVEVGLPNAGRVRGMGVRAGITLVVGGGFHGKSTLLEALQAGVYNKARKRVSAKACRVCALAHFRGRTSVTLCVLQVPGDGRELVATVPSAVKVCEVV